MAAGSFWEMAVMVLNPPAGHQTQVMTHFGNLPITNVAANHQCGQHLAQCSQVEVSLS